MTPRPILSRRALLATALALAAGPALCATPMPRVATLDWALLETLLAVGADVAAATELIQYRQVVVAPPLGNGVADLGLRGSPNLERLAGLRPDLIFNSNFYGWADPLLARIAPVESLSIHVPGTDPWEMAQKATLAIGERLSLPSAIRLVDALSERMAQLASRFAAKNPGPVLIANLGDPRHLRVFGADSMFGQALRRLGLDNAWAGATSYSAMAPVGIETLAALPDAFILFVGPHLPDDFDAMRQSAFWKALPQARNDRFLQIAPVNPYGALPSAERFANLFAQGIGIDV